jgi:hypothetical protein
MQAKIQIHVPEGDPFTSDTLKTFHLHFINFAKVANCQI